MTLDLMWNGSEPTLSTNRDTKLRVVLEQALKVVYGIKVQISSSRFYNFAGYLYDTVPPDTRTYILI